MTISSQTLCFEARRKCRVGFIHTQLASSYANAPQQLAPSPSTVGFITRDFHALKSRQYSQTNRRGLHMLFLASKSRCTQNISSVNALLTAQNVLSWSGRFGGGHTGWSQLQLASSVSSLCSLLRIISKGVSGLATDYRCRCLGPWTNHLSPVWWSTFRFRFLIVSWCEMLV